MKEFFGMYFDVIIISFFILFASVSLSKNNPMNHENKFRFRRFWNWFPLGLTYAFLYMGRYNLTVSKNALDTLMPNEVFGIIGAAGTWTYGISFLINGPLTDKLGGKFAILFASLGSAIMNAIMGILTYGIVAKGWDVNITVSFSILYALNMYAQSMGAVAIVKVNSYWFHIRERGVFGGIFGMLISLGLYFAFDWGNFIVKATVANPQDLTFMQSLLRSILIQGGSTTVNQTWWIFFIPSAILFTFFLIDLFVVKNSPKEANFPELDTMDASSSEMNQELSMFQILKKILTNPIILTIGAIEFCSGALRDGIIQWYQTYMKSENKLLASQNMDPVTFFSEHWGLLLMIAGVCAGLFAGFISDKVFKSRRFPVASILYLGMFFVVVLCYFNLKNYYALGAIAVFGALCVIGVHGMLSGTATMDFGGRKGAGTAVGVIDGMVYLGIGTQFLCIGFLSKISWSLWPVFLVPFTLIGLFLAIKLWKAFPDAKRKGGH